MKKRVYQWWEYVKARRWFMGYMAVLLLLLPLTVIIAGQQQNNDTHAAPLPLAIDVATGKNQSTAASLITSPTFSTKSGNELIVVFLTSDGSSSSAQTFTNVSGAGLQFTLAK